MPPHLTEYLDFVEDKTLFIYMKNGDIIIDERMSTAIGRLYIYIYWDKLIKAGNSPSALWQAMSSITNGVDPIRFNNKGYQINKPAMLELESPYFMGKMAEDYETKYWLGYFRIIVYLVLIFIGIYFVRRISLTDPLWNQLFILSKTNSYN